MTDETQQPAGSAESPKPAPPPNPLGSLMAPPGLALAADVLDDIERVRIANENRLRQAVRTGYEAESDLRGLEMMPPGIEIGEDDKIVDLVLEAAANHIRRQKEDGKKRITPPPGWEFFVWQMCVMLLPLRQANEDATKNVQKMIQQHPLHPWISVQKGLGDKQMGRLLATIGDPYWNTLHGRPRLVSELWSYCGYSVTPAGVAPARQKGVKINWSQTARMRCRMIAESCMKAGGPYREVYDNEKEHYQDAVHMVTCPRCGPAGKPAQPGSALSKNHIHARALRAISKTVLKDLWIEAKRIHAGRLNIPEEAA